MQAYELAGDALKLTVLTVIAEKLEDAKTNCVLQMRLKLAYLLHPIQMRNIYAKYVYKGVATGITNAFKVEMQDRHTSELNQVSTRPSVVIEWCSMNKCKLWFVTGCWHAG